MLVERRDTLGRARLAVGVALVVFLTGIVVFYGVNAPPPPPSEEVADAWMAAQDTVPETDVEAMATDADAAVAATLTDQDRVDAQLAELHKIAEVLKNRQNGGDAALLNTAAVAVAAKKQQQAKAAGNRTQQLKQKQQQQPAEFNPRPWRRPLTDTESPVQVVALLGIEGSRHQIVRDWLVSAAVASGRHVIPSASMWDPLVKKKAGVMRDRLSNVTTQAMHAATNAGVQPPAASVLVLAESWPARLLQRELPADCGNDFSKCEAAMVQHGVYDVGFMAATAAPVAQFRPIVLDRAFADCVAEHLSWDHTHAEHARLLARYKTHLAHSVERNLATIPWAYLATDAIPSVAGLESLLEYLNWNVTVAAVPESGHKSRRPNRAMPVDAVVVAAAAAAEEAQWNVFKNPTTSILIKN